MAKRQYTEEQKIKRRAANREWKIKNKERNTASYKKWISENKEKTKIYGKRAREKNKDKIKAKFSTKEYKEERNKKNKEIRIKDGDKLRDRERKYYQKTKETRRKKDKEWRMKNPDKMKVRSRRWREKAKKTGYQREYNKKRYEIDPIHRIKVLMRCRINKIFKSIKLNSKQVLKAEYEVVKIHIENQFKKGMTWENHGKNGWHIDHIIPLSSAKTEEDMITLCHYTNLQPLWEIDNLKKGSKIPNIQVKLAI